MPKQDQNEQGKKQENTKEAFSISVMPKEFRGREGLKKMYTADPAMAQPRPEPRKIVEPKPKVAKQVTPAVAGKATLQQPIMPQKKKPWIIIAVAGIVILLFGALGVVFLIKPSEPIKVAAPPTPVATRPTKAPSVTTTPQVKTAPTTPTAPVIPDPFAGEILPGKDTDSDGLTDIEEVLYGTQVNRPDTDQDGFLDGNEVFHLFHPNGFAPKTLLDTGAVIEVQPLGSNYQINRITRWQEQQLKAQRMYKITAPTGESFQVVQFAISPAETVQEFYTSKVIAGERQDLESLRTKQGFSGIWTEDHFSAYIRFNDNTLLVFTYNLGRAQRVEYRQTFEMFINSLKTVDES